MTKTYKLLIDSPEYPKGVEARWNDEDKNYSIYQPNRVVDHSDSSLEKWQIENRPEVWELVEDKLDLRSPEAEKMRAEARSKRWEFVPNYREIFFLYNLLTNNVCEDTWSLYIGDITNWQIGNCHRTKEEALAWGEKYARYFLTE